MVVAFVENSLAVPQLLNIELPYDLAIVLLGMSSWKIKSYIHTKTFTQMFIPASPIVDQKVETDEMSVSRWMDKQNVAFTQWNTVQL